MVTWSNEMDAVLIRGYGDLTAKRLARVLNVTPLEIYRRVKQLELARRRLWSRSEDLVLIWLYDRSARRCQRYLPQRTEGAVHARAHRIGLSKQRRIWAI